MHLCCALTIKFKLCGLTSRNCTMGYKRRGSGGFWINFYHLGFFNVNLHISVLAIFPTEMQLPFPGIEFMTSCSAAEHHSQWATVAGSLSICICPILHRFAPNTDIYWFCHNILLPALNTHYSDFEEVSTLILQHSISAKTTTCGRQKHSACYIQCQHLIYLAQFLFIIIVFNS